jgi:zinc protease
VRKIPVSFIIAPKTDMLNRTIAPSLGLPEKISVPPPVNRSLPGNISFMTVNGGTQDIVRLELIFSAGQSHAFPPVIASAASELADEGTAKHTSAQLAEKLDLYGAFLETECGADWASVTLYTLTRFLNDTLPLLVEIATSAVYPEKEVETFKVQGKQRLLVSLEKVDYLARRHFSAALFGKDHSFGYIPSPASYDVLDSGSLRRFFGSNYQNGLTAVVLSGKYSQRDEELIFNSIAGSGLKPSQATEKKDHFPAEGERIRIRKEGAIQSAIRIGRKLFNRSHPDYFAFSVLNTVLGGYFGSRLMSNIREDKGYTYGIGSGLMSQKNLGYFFISTEVGSEVADAAVKEIYFEIERLRNDLVSEAELDLVKKYLWGSFQRSIDGPLALADRHKALLLSGIDQGYYKRYLDTLQNIGPEDLREQARRYLSDTDLTQVVVGP